VKQQVSRALCNVRPAVLQGGWQHERTHSLIVALLAITVLASCAPRPQPLPPQRVTPAEIVAQNASDAFATFLDPTTDRAAMQSFATSIASAATRQNLILAWNQIPTLASKGTTFLQDHVFSKSTAEAKWPTNRTPEQLEPAFAQGVRTAVTAFLAGSK